MSRTRAPRFSPSPRVESTLRDGAVREYFGTVLADATLPAGPLSLQEGAPLTIETGRAAAERSPDEGSRKMLESVVIPPGAGEPPAPCVPGSPSVDAEAAAVDGVV